MSNVLKVSLQTTIYSLHDRGWSQRRIARELGINRETMGRYLRLAKSSISTTGSEGGKKAKPANLTAGGFTLSRKTDKRAQEWDHTSFAARWAGVLTIVDWNSICPPELGGVSAGGAVLIRLDGYVGFQEEKWNAEARSALDGFLSIQFSPAGM